MTDSVQVFPPGVRLVDTTGVPYSGAYAEFYDAGTNTARAVFSDQDLTVSLGTVVYTDAAGYPVASQGSSTKVLVYTGTASYKIVLKDATGAVIATHDNVQGAVISGSGGGSASGITQAQADARYVRNPNALSAQTTLDDSDIFPFWDTGSSANVGLTWGAMKSELVAELRAAGTLFSTGVASIFYNASAPTGWTKSTALNNAALRIVSGSGGVSGGSADFTTVFASRTLTRANLPNTSIACTVSDPGHVHSFSVGNAAAGGGATGIGAASTANTTSSTTGISVSFNLNGNVTQTALDFAVKYADAIICVKD